MTDKLVDMLPNFLGQANHCHCFLHIVNLIVKTLLKQFDVPKKNVDAALNAAERELLELAAGINMEEMVTIAEIGAGDKDDDETDNVEGWVDEMALLSDEERAELNKNIGPVRLVLVKVSESEHCLTLLTRAPIALKTGMQDPPFSDKALASMV